MILDLPRRHLILAALLISAVVFGAIQGSGGAYTAEFDGHPDEPSHFMTALMLRDYALTWPPPNPLPWAEQYYLHYPRVALGHWPPLFHMLLGTWWIVLPPGRVTAILLCGILAVLSALLFYALASRAASKPVAAFVTALLIVSPLFQHGATQVMSEQLVLLLAILFIDSVARLTGSGGSRGRIWMVSLLTLSLLVKGTALALIPVPLLAILLSGNRSKLRILLWPSAAVLAVMGACALWYSYANRDPLAVLRWAGIGIGKPWNWQALRVLTGWGGMFVALSRALVRRRFTALDSVCFAVILSMIVVSWLIRAMDSDRHWIAALPALLLLIASVFDSMRPAFSPAIAAAILVWFPWHHYRQSTRGMAEVVAAIPLPTRVLVSSADPIREGPWVAAIAERDKRVSSLVARATRSVARESFSGNHYSLQVRDEVETAAYLDRYAIEFVLLDDTGDTSGVRPHQELLRKAMANGSWALAVSRNGITLYRRTQPPKVAREPFSIYMRSRLGRRIVEAY